MKHKLKIGDRVTGGNITYQVTTVSAFSATEHYGVLFNQPPVDGENTEFHYGWIPCEVLDAMVEPVRYRLRYNGVWKDEKFYTEKDAMEWASFYTAELGLDEAIQRYHRPTMEWQEFNKDTREWVDIENVFVPTLEGFKVEARK